MRHDPASAAIVVMLRGLKMYGMAQAVGELMEQGAHAFDVATSKRLYVLTPPSISSTQWS